MTYMLIDMNKNLLQMKKNIKNKIKKNLWQIIDC